MGERNLFLLNFIFTKLKPFFQLDSLPSLLFFLTTLLFFFRDQLLYSLVSDSNDDSSKFDVHASTGQIFVVDTSSRKDLNSICPNSCKFKAAVTDTNGVQQTQINVQIVPLLESQIIPLNINVS
jgi:hypothetical protein